MTAWLALAGAVVLEVAGTTSLRMAATGRRTWYAVMAGCYALAFVLLSAALAAGLPLGVAYGTWAAVGVALTALVSRVVFGEPLTRVMVAGIALIAGGVLLVELGH